MDITTSDIDEFFIYKGISQVGLVKDDCLQCQFPELRHFNLPQPKNVIESSANAPSTPPVSNNIEHIGVSPTSAPALGGGSPNSMPTLGGNGETCVSDAKGDYFLTSSQSNLASNSNNMIQYKYRLETQKDGADISSEVLPFLEKALLDSIIPDLFSGHCNSSRSLQKYFHSSRKLSIVGASTKPVDLIAEDEICGSERQDLDCNIVNGRMTIMSDGSTLNIEEIDSLICEALNNESLTYAHPTIDSVQCIPWENNIINGEDGDAINPDEVVPIFEPARQRIGAYGFLVSIAATLVVIFGIYGYKRRHRGKDESPREVNPLDDSDIVNMSNSVSYEAGISQNSQPAMDFTSILSPKLGGAGNCLPQTIDESSEEDEEGQIFEEVNISG